MVRERELSKPVRIFGRTVFRANRHGTARESVRISGACNPPEVFITRRSKTKRKKIASRVQRTTGIYALVEQRKWGIGYVTF